MLGSMLSTVSLKPHRNLVRCYRLLYQFLEEKTKPGGTEALSQDHTTSGRPGTQIHVSLTPILAGTLNV